MAVKVTCTRRIQFCAGHRVLNHEGKCANPHGHNYVALVTAEATQLDHVGRVIDFSVIKDKIGGWIEQNWDHKFLVNIKDHQLYLALLPFKQSVVQVDFNPTAEEMAKCLLSISNYTLNGTGITVTKVQLWETENCYAEAT